MRDVFTRRQHLNLRGPAKWLLVRFVDGSLKYLKARSAGLYADLSPEIMGVGFYISGNEDDPQWMVGDITGEDAVRVVNRIGDFFGLLDNWLRHKENIDLMLERLVNRFIKEKHGSHRRERYGRAHMYVTEL